MVVSVWENRFFFLLLPLFFFLVVARGGREREREREKSLITPPAGPGSKNTEGKRCVVLLQQNLDFFRHLDLSFIEICQFDYGSDDFALQMHLSSEMHLKFSTFFFFKSSFCCGATGHTSGHTRRK